MLEKAQADAFQSPATECPLLSIVFISYRRLVLLRQTFDSVRAAVSYPRLELIVADDGSPPEMQAAMRQLGFDRHILASKNRGLGANNNAALGAASGEYVLMLQDDWLATPLTGPAINRAMAILGHDADIGIVRLYPGYIDSYPLVARRLDDFDYYVCDHRSPAYDRQRQVYSDTPHIRKAAINDPAVLGRYREDVPMETTEQDYADRFDAQDRYKIAFLDRGDQVYFVHIGDDQSHRTSKLRYRLDQGFLKAAAWLGLRKSTALYRALRSVWFSVRTWLIEVRLLR